MRNNRSIWSYPVDLDAVNDDDPVRIIVQAGARLLYAAARTRQVIVYAIVDPTIRATEPRDIWVIGTGQPFPDTLPDTARHLGVVAMEDGTVILHVFCQEEPEFSLVKGGGQFGNLYTVMSQGKAIGRIYESDWSPSAEIVGRKRWFAILSSGRALREAFLTRESAARAMLNEGETS